jgi:small subunit ribosomal protein S5
MEAAGVTDVLAKTFGSRNPVNVSRATIEGLSTLQDPAGARARRLAIARGEQ